MAWRIDEHVVRGEIDNRIRGQVTGRIWFEGRPAPVELTLRGDAWRDLAGRRLEFVNPTPKPGLPESFAAQQQGAVGDLTASRKVRVPDIPLEQIGEYYARKEPFPWHWGNSCYLEWFSARNGRVVIESAHFTLTVSTEATWEMSEAEEEAQRQTNGTALGEFIERMGRAVAAEKSFIEEDLSPRDSAESTDAGEAGDTPAVPGRPQTEAEADRMLEESERLQDRIQARLAREGDKADLAKIIAEEVARRRAERGDTPRTPEEEAEHAAWMAEMRGEAEEATEEREEADGAGWLHREDDEAADDADSWDEPDEHPLIARGQRLALRLMQEPPARGWLADNAPEEHPLVDFAAAVMKGGAKLAGALGGEEFPPPVDDCAAAIARLKRARAYFEDAAQAAAACAEQGLAEATWLAEVSAELRGVAQETDDAIALLRTRLEDGSA